MTGGPPRASYPQAPYPHARREREASAAVHALCALPTPRTRAEAAVLLGGEATLEPLPYELLDAAEARAISSRPLCALQLELAEGARRHALLCELPCELAARVVDRVLGGDGEPAQPIGHPLDDVSLGVLAYVAARLCAAGDAVLRVAALLDRPEDCAALLEGSRVVCLPLQLRIDDRVYGGLRVFVPEPTARQLAARTVPSSHALHDPLPAARALPLALWAVCARTTLLRRELAALSPGDVVVPERCALQPGPDGYGGAVELCAQGVALRLQARIHATQLVIERREPYQEPPVTEAERTKTTASTATAAAALGDDTPIELCLTLARFTLPLAELSALQPGDVLETGRAIGSRVALTAGGRAVAFGELVEVDGDVGLRVLELCRGDAREGG
jgi:type III secretion protein Q